jgi:hypothetical protein
MIDESSRQLSANALHARSETKAAAGTRSPLPCAHTILVLVGFDDTLLSAHPLSDGSSDFWWRIFGIERCLEKARSDRGLSSPNPVVIVCRKVQ